MRCAREEEALIVFDETSVTRAREELQERPLRFVAIFRGELTLNFVQDDDMTEQPIDRKCLLAELCIALQPPPQPEWRSGRQTTAPRRIGNVRVAASEAL